MDCMDAMKDFPDKYFELCITDPPYGIGVNNSGWIKQGNQRNPHKIKKWDNVIPDEKYFTELFRVSQNQIIWGGNYFDLKPTRCFLIWDKVVRMDQADCELAWTSFINSARIFRYAKGNESGFAPMLDVKNGVNIHPTQKPIALYKWLLTNYAKKGDKILDTHAGSCSSVIACIDGGFDWIAIEKDVDYYKSATERINNHVRQTDLFNANKQDYIQQSLL
jgi:site-specific DNA-methyltransferase (adenine-specific)